MRVLAVVVLACAVGLAVRAEQPAPAAPSTPAPAAPVPAAPAPAAPPAAAPEAAAAAPKLQPWFELHDQLYPQRDDAAVVTRLSTLLAGRVAERPDDYEGWWRRAQLFCWQAGGFPNGSDLKAAYGKKCWEAADKAVALRPADVKGQYWAGVGIGLYSEGVGILTALTQGLEGKFRERTQEAMKLDDSYLEGAARQLWGRYFFTLPWPKRDNDESIKQLTQAHQAFPANLRTRYYLADSLLKDGKDKEAKDLAQGIVAAQARDAEDRRVQGLAKKWLKDHE